MEEDTEYKKLSVEDRCVHKLWKARVSGYEEATKIFNTIDDEKSNEWNKFSGLIRKMVVDSQAKAQEKGLEAALVFVENCGSAGKTAGDVMAGIVGKCVAAPKTRTKELSVQLTLMYVEIEKQDVVIEELLKGVEHKNPKIVAACTTIIQLAIHEFGHKVFQLKPIIKKIPVLLSDRDKSVREEAKSLTIELYRWIGEVLKPQLTALTPVLLAELESEFEKVKGFKPEISRFLKSQQNKQQVITSTTPSDEGCADVDTDNNEEEIDPMDLIDPVDILSKLPKDFYDKLDSNSWKERKESLDALETLLQNPKLESGDYGDVVRVLKKILSKDLNVVLVALAGKCIAMLAKGLTKRFHPYAGACVPAILEKFKEKKPAVQNALRDAIDAVYPATTLEAIQEDIFEALNNKNPSVKAETVAFLSRSFTKTQPAAINKKIQKGLVTALLKTLSESDPTVRENSAEALGTLMKLLSEKSMMSYLTDVDAIKMAKIKECADKAVIVVKIANAKKERPVTAPVKAPATSTTTITKAVEPKRIARPATAASKSKLATKKTQSAVSSSTGTGSGGGGLQKSASTTKVLPTERDLSEEEVSERVTELLQPDIISGLSDANWKTRLSAVESMTSAIDSIEASSGVSQVLSRTLIKKPGLKETNFQVLKGKLEIIKLIAEKFGVTVTTCDYLINDITEKLGDVKNSAVAAQALSAIAESLRLDIVVTKVIQFAFEQKSPKVQAEAFNWVGSAIQEFGFVINTKALLDDVKKGVQSTNPLVRTAAISLLGILFMYMGGNVLNMLFDGEKPALKQQIQNEFDKYANQKPPAPIRGVKKSSSDAALPEDDDEAASAAECDQLALMNELVPRVDISSQITEALLNEIADKNWKTRNEGLTKLQTILNDAKLIKTSIGDLPQELSRRLLDSNAKIAQVTVQICQQIAIAMGAACKQHLRVLFPGLLHGLSDNKKYIRDGCIACMNTWGEQCGYKEFFEGEMIADALKSGSPALRVELWAWLAEHLHKLPPKSITKEELIACLPSLYANICDRSVDVRKNANEAVLGLMMHLGYDSMVKAMDKQKPSSKKDILAALDKARPNLPAKPLPKSKQQAPIMEELPKATKSAPGKPQKVVTQASKLAPVASRKKDEDVDTSPLLAVNNIKNQRLIDEQKLKVLKWAFTTPREEFVELLRDQMSTANVNKGLMANMFHDDFRYHLKAIEALNEDLPNNFKALICNLDLILKWVSLRFYDTNPSVLLKGLEYLNIVFDKLIEDEYVITENEAGSFLPHLVIKIGDPKDAVRIGVRSLLRKMCMIYPYSKMFSYVMEGLKSKNARLRAECLEELEYFIKKFQLTACQPSPQVALKEIARQISDRDNSVRNNALNCIVQAYFLAGDKVYKYIGQLSEKDLSMLEERIKRAKKTRKVEEVVKAPAVAAARPESAVVVEEEEYMEPEEIPPVEVASPTVFANSTFVDVMDTPPPGATFDIKLLPLPKLDPTLVSLVEAVGSFDSMKARAAIKTLGDIIQSPERQAVLQDYNELFLQSILTQLKHLSQFPVNESLVIYRPLLAIIFDYFSVKCLCKNVGVASLKNIIAMLLTLMADQKLSAIEDGQYAKVINAICVKILDRANFSRLNCALIRLLKETCMTAGLPKFTDLLMKCIWRNVKVMPDRAIELNYDAILLEVHEFLVALPTHWWQSRPSDTPLRTMKTIIHSMAKIKGNAILQNLGSIPANSELRAYLIKVLRNVPNTNESNKPAPLSQRTASHDNDPGKRAKHTHESMSQIFKLISDKDTSKEGLSKLYEFKVKNPDIDFAPFLKGASPSFQRFIEEGLAEIAGARQRGENLDKDFADEMMDRLNSHRLRFGLKRLYIENENAGMVDNKIADENLNLNQIQPKPTFIKREVREPMTPNRIEQMKQKLAEIRHESQN